MLQGKPDINSEISFKPMSYDELSISLERLQRFNNPFRRHDRVCREILIKHLIVPKISLKNYHEFSFGEINSLAQFIWNQSVQMLNQDCAENYGINLYLLYEEMKEFYAGEILRKIIFSENISGYTKPANFAESDFIYNEAVIKNIFEENGINIKNDNYGLAEIYISAGMNYPINIDGFLKIAETRENVSKNTKRLIWLNKQTKKATLNINSKDLYNELEKLYNLAENYRKNFSSGKPVKLLILVEGATEEILLPVFASVAGIEFDKNGIEVLASGGKNQVAKIYSEIREEVNLPVFIILDADAEEIAAEIKENIRPQDRLYVLSAGEFEDLLPDNLICRAVNSYYGHTGKIKQEEINTSCGKTHSLVEVWKQKGFGGFKKAEFARIIAENIKDSADLSEEMKKIILNIKEMQKPSC